MDLSDLKRDSLNASINGKVDLSLLGLFTPFISDLRGYMALSMDIRGSALKPNVSGSAYIERGYAKFSDFYHRSRTFRADLLFNDNQILLNALRADLASGKISGDGKLTFLGEGKRQVEKFLKEPSATSKLIFPKAIARKDRERSRSRESVSLTLWPSTTWSPAERSSPSSVNKQVTKRMCARAPICRTFFHKKRSIRLHSLSTST